MNTLPYKGIFSGSLTLRLYSSDIQSGKSPPITEVKSHQSRNQKPAKYGSKIQPKLEAKTRQMRK